MNKTLKENIITSYFKSFDVNSMHTMCNYRNQLFTYDKCILDDYREVLNNLTIEIDLDSKYFYKPSLFAQDMYGEAGLDFLVLYMSGIFSSIDFNKTKIRFLPPEFLSIIKKIIIDNREKVRSSNENPKTHTIINY